MTHISSRVQLQRFLKTETSQSREEIPSRAIRSNSNYNLKDFLPDTSLITIESRQKINSTIMPTTFHPQNKFAQSIATTNVNDLL